MDYGIYKHARNASWQCLIDCQVTELPVKPVQIANHYGILCKSNAGLLQPGESAQRKRYTILHELGHYLLGHLDGDMQPEMEYAADPFCSRCIDACVRSVGIAAAYCG